MGLSLEQIARLLNQGTSADQIRGMLTLRKAQIEQSVQTELERLRVVEARLHQIDVHGQMQEPDVILKAVPAQQFLALRDVLPNLQAVQQRVERIARHVPAAVGQHNLSHVAIIIHSSVYDPEAFDFKIGYLLTGKAPQSVRLSEERVLTRRELPAIDTLATLVHAGQVSAIHQSYGALGRWVEQQQWRIMGTGRQILMQLPLPNNDNDAVVELQLPVCRIDEKLVLDFDVTSKATL